MQRWRVLSYVAVASAFLAAPSWLLAQQAKPENPAAATVPVAAAPAAESAIELFAPLTQYAWPERIGLILTLLIAVSGLGYAGMLVGQDLAGVCVILFAHLGLVITHLADAVGVVGHRAEHVHRDRVAGQGQHEMPHIATP